MSRIIKIEIDRCTDCIFYNLKKNKCILGAKDKGDQQDNFYLDCPLECGEVKKMNNKQLGNEFEKDFCLQLAADGFWAHFMGGSKNGQPADIIAVRNERAYLIDAKDCENDRFAFSRIEDNQDSAMRLWELCGNNQGLFALRTSKGVYMMTYGMVQGLQISGVKSLNMEKIKAYCIPYEEWVGEA